ncbi:peroxiredoxin [Nocardia sp. XZ_19_385]|uniref:peroxiredoxin family protein n=1 Tax=Nocardia sp. XZ_19_385 TaxID=2769488 RepID=UPI00188E54F1|nr:MauE/DoxX family redox-associated membrane protein [Nocardia sp. XZ_19_385]
MAEYGVWVVRLGLAVVFGLAAWGKLADRVGARQAVVDFGVPVRWGPAVAWALPVLEAGLAVGVLAPWTAVGAAVAALLVLAVFTAAMARLLAQGKRPACSCFGAAGSAPIGRRTLVRNAVLMLFTVLAAVGSVVYQGVPGELPADHAVGLVVVAVLAALLVWGFGQVQTLRWRLDEQALSTLGAEGLPVGAVAPEFELLGTAGDRVSLAELLAHDRQVLLVFVHPGCEMCAALARELPRWQQRTEQALRIAVVGNGDLAEHARWGAEQGLGAIPVLVQQGNEAALRYRVRGTPSGVLIRADGRIAGQVARGAMAVRELIMQAKNTGRQPVPRQNGQRVPDRR